MRLPHPLLVCADPALRDDVLRLAATAGCELAVETDVSSARRVWSSAPAVLLDSDLAPTCLSLGLPQRPGLVLLVRGPAGEQIWQQAVALGAGQVLGLPDAEPLVVDLLADAADERDAHAVVVGVVGGRGGAGASTLAAALALTGARRGYEALLVDADPLAGGVDLLLGREGEAGLRWPDLTGSRGRIPATALAAALPRPHGLMVLSWDRRATPAVSPEAMSAVLGAAVRAADLVVVDLPRRPDDAAQVALERAALVLLLVPAEVRACAAAARVAALTASYCCDLRLVVRGPGPGGVDAQLVAGILDLPLAGTLRTERRLPSAQERGEPPARHGRGPLAGLCAALLADLLPPPHPERTA